MSSPRSRNDPRYGKGQHTIAFSPEDDLDEAAVRARILAVFNDPGYQPPTLPSVALELLELSRRPDVGFPQVVAVLEQDAMLAGRVLKMAQSPVYGGAVRVESLQEALVRLGIRTLRDLVLEVATRTRVFRCPAYAESMQRLSHHSMVTAYLARVVSRYTAMAEEYAFLCGLLHDVGIAGILLVLGDAKRGKTTPDLTQLWRAVDAAHDEAGAIMARIWQLPAEIPLVISAHHRVAIDGFDHPLAATVCLADHLASELGAGLAGGEKDEGGVSEDGLLVDCTTPKTLERARAALRLTDAQMKLIRADAERVVSEQFGSDA